MSKLCALLRRPMVAVGVATVVGAGVLAAGPGLGAVAGASPTTSGGGHVSASPTPVMGWSSWSFLRLGVDAPRIEAEGRALVSSGLARAGDRYDNVDDNWYVCPGSQGPDVDAYGRWVVNASEFPRTGGQSGIAAVASYVHHLGLKFGIYETPGISEQAVAKDTPVYGTTHTARQIAGTTTANNYNCGGMLELDYSKAGAQAYTDSVVAQLASWGVDFIKLDGITNHDGPSVEAWSTAIRRSGRPMVLDITQGSYTIALAPTLERYADQWEFTPDIEINGPDEGSADACNTAPFTGCLSVFPLTSYDHWRDRFAAVQRWSGVGGQGGFNDYDSIEVGNGSADSGMSPDAERSQLSLWALGAAPLILGGDLDASISNVYGSAAGLDPAGLAMLTNPRVIAVDQDAIAAARISEHGSAQVFAKRERAGDAVAGLFDTADTGADPITTTPHALGLRADPHGYRVQDLWSGAVTTIPAAGAIHAEVAPEGVDLVEVTPAP